MRRHSWAIAWRYAVYDHFKPGGLSRESRNDSNLVGAGWCFREPGERWLAYVVPWLAKSDTCECRRQERMDAKCFLNLSFLPGLVQRGIVTSVQSLLVASCCDGLVFVSATSFFPRMATIFYGTPASFCSKPPNYCVPLHQPLSQTFASEQCL